MDFDGYYDVSNSNQASLLQQPRPIYKFLVNHLVQFIANPTPPHWLSIKQFFKYLKCTMNIGFIYYGGNFHSSSNQHHLIG